MIAPMSSHEPQPDPAPGAPRAPRWQSFIDGLRRFVARRVPPADAEDVAQDALLRIHQGFAGLRDVERTQAWVFGIARRAVADYYRARRPPGEGVEVDPDTLADSADGPEASLADFDGDHSVHEEVVSWLRPIAESLPEKYRDALLMADFDGRTQREVAAELGLSLSGAKSRVQRARRMLAEDLERCCRVEVDSQGRARGFERNDCDC